MIVDGLNYFVSGALMMACAAIALFFARFFARSRERLFAILAIAFSLLALERIPLAFLPLEHEGRHLVYLIRLAAFVAILAGVIDKNWLRRRRSGR